MLLALDKKGIVWESTMDEYISVKKFVILGCGCCSEYEEIIKIPLNQQPKEWSEDIISKLMEIL